MDAELDRILDPGYLEGLAELSVTELRARREECQAVETGLSYLRRLVQGHRDIVGGEVERRAGGRPAGDLADLVERLPDILSDRIHAPGPGRLPAAMAPGDLSGRLAERLGAITAKVPLERLAEVGDDELAATAAELDELEQEVSGLRRALFDRIDPLQAEITERYKAGEANVDDLLEGA